MKDNWRDFGREDWKGLDSWNFERYKPGNIKDAFGYHHIFIPYKRWGWLAQVMAAVILFFAFVAFFSWDNPHVLGVQQSVRYYLVENNSDYTPVLEAMVRDGLWLDSYERHVFNAQKPDKKRAKDTTMAIPVSGKNVRQFGWLQSSITGDKVFHSGIDIETELGAPVRAALDGVVVKVETTEKLGRTIEIDHGQGLTTLYGTLGEILVEEGMEVRQGEIIGKTGQVANSNKGRLHFEVREKGRAVDPLEKITNVRTSI